jgi:hypothetical protein
MIDPATEELIPLRLCNVLFPPRRLKRGDDPDGERAMVGYTSLLKWCLHGDPRGVRLETVVIGGCRYSSRQAVNRFIAAGQSDPTAPARETLIGHERRLKRAKEAAQKALSPPKRKSAGKAAKR